MTFKRNLILALALFLVGANSFHVIKAELDEGVSPATSFKLIGIFVVDSKPLAIIENILDSSKGRQEYSVGDYLDEMQTVSVAKITLSPTAKVELLDSNGDHYLIRPNVIADNKGVSTATKFNKSTTFKAKFNSKPTSAPAPPPPPPPANNAPQEDTADNNAGNVAGNNNGVDESDAMTAPDTQVDPVSGDNAPAVSEDKQQEAAQSATANSNETGVAPDTNADAFDTSRPANPFAE